MKRVLCAAACVVAGLSTTANAELAKVYACQYSDAIGFIFNNGRWERSGFRVRPPFFIKTDGSTILEAGDLNSDYIDCTNTSTGLYQCGDKFGASLYFSVHTMRGGFSHLFGATQDEDDQRDTVTALLFVCEAM